MNIKVLFSLSLFLFSSFFAHGAGEGAAPSSSAAPATAAARPAPDFPVEVRLMLPRHASRILQRAEGIRRPSKRRELSGIPSEYLHESLVYHRSGDGHFFHIKVLKSVLFEMVSNKKLHLELKYLPWETGKYESEEHYKMQFSLPPLPEVIKNLKEKYVLVLEPFYASLKPRHDGGVIVRTKVIMISGRLDEKQFWRVLGE